MEGIVVYFTLAVVLLQVSTALSAPYYGALIGDISTINHEASGTVYAASATTLIIRGFSYDGSAPDAFLWIGSSAQPDPSGVILPVDPNYPDNKLGRFTDVHLVLDLPSGTTISDYRWLSVWCRLFTANFGFVNILSNFVAPAVHDLGSLPTYAHQVSADSVKVVDAKTLRFENLFYDGNGPDAYFWAGTTQSPTQNGFKIIWKPNLPATGTNQRIDRSYSGDTIEVTMPDGMTVFDITYVGLWCVRFTQNFGHVSIDPSELNVPAVLPDVPFDHCEVLSDNEFQVSWRIFGASIKVQLAGRVDAGNYLAFGLSGSDTETLMDGSDVVVAWMDEQSMGPMVVDYNLQSKAQGTTNCPVFTASSGGGTPLEAWAPSSIEDETTFTVDIGQSGGERGYTGITGKVGWGIAWYVNDLLIPEITVQRGTTYTFQVFGGDDPAISAQYHPFYITDDAEGGYAQKMQAEQMGVTIYAGPTDGPYCEWQVQTPGISPDNYDSFLTYRYNLQRNCNDPSPTAGVLTWTPDGSTPDLVYYQCYTHRFLGWKIRVVDGPGVTGTMPRAPTTDRRPTTTAGLDEPGTSTGSAGSTDLAVDPNDTGSAIASVAVSVAVMIISVFAVLLI